MLLDAVLAYLHFAAIFLLVWFLAREWTLLGAGAEGLDARRLALADMGYGLASLGVLLTGVSRLAFGAKPLVFYLHNPVFHAKVGLFVLVGLLSIAPTRRILQWRRAVAQNAGFRPDATQWRSVRRFVLIELHLIALIPLLAVLMARAIGYQA
jgi:putative membrane protein